MEPAEVLGSAAETTSTTPAQTAVSSARPERSENFILVSLERTPRLYSRIAKRVLMGREGKEAFDEFSVSGKLGAGDGDEGGDWNCRAAAGGGLRDY
ncbi:hypothetical protein, conserved [Eimeria tenella]|uniref:Uncharacterized protein n=2 Tax=Eimeria TaxID=5800 RepID=U6L3V3_EIMTE|nr:hypothetical protein, conserved [Eimeria tenella]CDJ45072.1 hypothetical protein, conserved [Eimeria tenella]|eukprot:XP_013235819.1 hypothetical protein, conserved [Eimeria tenella]